jgi:predicted Fe-Mo cluster-binding NifX family protein
MKVAVPIWQNRISPLFDVAEILALFDIDKNQAQRYRELCFPSEDSSERIRMIHTMHIDVLLCAGISEPMERTLTSLGITVIPNVCGPVDEVITAFVHGRIEKNGYE